MIRSVLMLLILFLVACTGPGAQTGFAPGGTAPPTPPPIPNSTIKFGETVMTANNWQVSSDNADPVEQKTLSNGWTVEVKYE